MKNIWSRHLTINRELPNDRRYVRDFMNADFFSGEVLLLHF